MDAQLQIFNELVDEYAASVALTFQDTARDSNQRARIVENVHTTARRIADRAEYIANHVAQLTLPTSRLQAFAPTLARRIGR
jgi:hypothetical protein